MTTAFQTHIDGLVLTILEGQFKEVGSEVISAVRELETITSSLLFNGNEEYLSILAAELSELDDNLEHNHGYDSWKVPAARLSTLSTVVGRVVELREEAKAWEIWRQNQNAMHLLRALGNSSILKTPLMTLVRERNIGLSHDAARTATELLSSIRCVRVEGEGRNRTLEITHRGRSFINIDPVGLIG